MITHSKSFAFSKSNRPRTLQHAISTNYANGFTLIEVVLVLAIGGLIFLMAFLAFGQVQRNRRDTQRREDAQRLIALLENSVTNNGGSYPCTAAVSSPLYTVSDLDPSYSGRTTKTGYLDGCKGLKVAMQTDDSFNIPSSQSSAHFGYRDPTGDNEYIVISNKNTNLIPHRMWAFIGAECSGSSGGLNPVESVTSFAVRVGLENGVNYCVDNS